MFFLAGQPPTPSTTPGIQQGAFGFQGVGVGQLGGAGPLVGGGGLGIIPEHLAESIHRSLRVRDEARSGICILFLILRAKLKFCQWKLSRGTLK